MADGTTSDDVVASDGGQEDREIGRKAVIAAAAAVGSALIALCVVLLTGSAVKAAWAGVVASLVLWVGPSVTLFKDDIRRIAVPKRAVYVAWGAVAMLLIAAVVLTLVNLPPTQSGSRADPPRSTSSAVSTAVTSQPAPTTTARVDGPLAMDNACGDLSPTDWVLPAYQLCVVNWCQGIVTLPSGQIDQSRMQIKLHPRIVNNTPEPLNISIARRPAALRLLVASSDLPSSWRPPGLTADHNDAPYLVQLQGQRYWAVAPNLPHDIDATAGAFTGFATFWDSDWIEPNSFYPPPTQRDAAGNAIEQQGDLVFQLPSTNNVNNARVAGLALISAGDPTNILAFADYNDWGPRLDPNQF